MILNVQTMILQALTITAALTAVAYLTYAIKQNKGIPDSISATSYAIKNPTEFTTAMFTEAALLLPAFIDKTPDQSWLAFLAVTGLVAVGSTPNYRTEGRTLHNIGAFMAGIGGQLAIALNNPIILSTWALFPLTLIQKKNYTFWAEIICLLNIIMYNLI